MCVCVQEYRRDGNMIVMITLLTVSYQVPLSMMLLPTVTAISQPSHNSMILEEKEQSRDRTVSTEESIRSRSPFVGQDGYYQAPIRNEHLHLVI